MRRIVVAISLLAFGAGVVEAEARAKFRGGGSYVAPSRGAVSTTPGLAVIPALTLRPGYAGAANRDAAGSPPSRPVGVMTAEALGPGEPGNIPIPAAAPPAPVKKAVEPWCRSGRIAGSGAGFCLIN